MTTARAHLVNPDADAYYHCMSRCVRRGWLCGEDPVSGRSYEHRKGWIESRILLLCEVFTLELCSYAVMSNHYHVVVHQRPSVAKQLSDREVAQRWLRLCSRERQANADREIELMMADEERLVELRKRLGSLSWFMKSLNEPISRAANREDGCKGRFWESRFVSVALLDEPSLVNCMAYVDLNPVRAGIVDEPTEAPHTSINRRVRMASANIVAPPLVDLDTLGITLTGYIDLLRWTAQHEAGVRVQPKRRAKQVLRQLNQAPLGWLDSTNKHRHRFRVYGGIEHLRRYAQTLGQQWVKGIGVTT